MKPTLALILLATLAGTAAAQGPAPDNGTGLSTPDGAPLTPQPPQPPQPPHPQQPAGGGAR